MERWTWTPSKIGTAVPGTALYAIDLQAGSGRAPLLTRQRNRNLECVANRLQQEHEWKCNPVMIRREMRGETSQEETLRRVPLSLSMMAMAMRMRIRMPRRRMRMRMLSMAMFRRICRILR